MYDYIFIYMYVSILLWFWGLNPYSYQVSTLTVNYVNSPSEKFSVYFTSTYSVILCQALTCTLEYGFESLIIIVLRVVFKNTDY